LTRKPLNGRDLPVWAYLPDAARLAWEAAALAVKDQPNYPR